MQAFAIRQQVNLMTAGRTHRPIDIRQHVSLRQCGRTHAGQSPLCKMSA